MCATVKETPQDMACFPHQLQPFVPVGVEGWADFLQSVRIKIILIYGLILLIWSKEEKKNSVVFLKDTLIQKKNASYIPAKRETLYSAPQGCCNLGQHQANNQIQLTTVSIPLPIKLLPEGEIKQKPTNPSILTT